MADQAAKRLKTDSSSITIATHNGHFHADEALAVHMLRRHVPEYAGASLVRTRNPAVLADSHTVVDVGGEYDAAKLRFDHHQRDFTTTFPGRATKLSSAGLVYMHFGRGIVERAVRLRETAAAAAAPTADADIDMLYNKLYSGLIEALDAHDNGIDAYDPAELATANNGEGITKRFSDGGFTLGAVVGRYNASWNDADKDQASEDARFEKASARIGEEFDRSLKFLVGGWLPARSLVQAAFEARTEYDSAGRLLVFRSQSCPWKDHLYAQEAEAEAKTGTETKVVYVLYPDNEQRWRVQCVPADKDSFSSRKPLPEAWRGHRDGELDTILEGTVEPGAVFVHAAGFIGGHRTFEGALAMAKKALEL